MIRGTAITCLLAILQATSAFSPSGLQSKHIICPSPSSFATSTTSTFQPLVCKQNIKNNDISTRLYMSEGSEAAAVPPKKGFLEKVCGTRTPNLLYFIVHHMLYAVLILSLVYLQIDQGKDSTSIGT